MNRALMVALGVVVALLPEVLRLAGDERSRRVAAEQAERQREYNREQRELDRKNAVDVALAAKPEVRPCP